MEKYLEFSSTTKRFAGVVALDAVTFSVHKGEIHGLCGENGAGKSTLINICAGAYKSDGGSFSVKEAQAHFASPRDAERHGIGVVFQEVPMCMNMSIAANIFLSPHPETRRGSLDWRRMNAETAELMALFQIKRQPRDIVGNLTIAEQSLIQIARVLKKAPDCLILDEPTSTLSPDQKDILFDVLRKYRSERGMTILYVSHRMEELFELTDRITILKDGKYIATLDTPAVTPREVVRLMVGREIEESRRADAKKGAVALSVRNITRKGALRDVSFDAHYGEILGFSGLQGAGRSELARVIFGLDPKDAGEIIVDGKSKRIDSVSDAIQYGIGYISENRRDDGIVSGMSVRDNIIMVSLKELSKLKVLQKDKIRDVVKQYIARLSIKVSSHDQVISGLSGGNQQKVILSRWLAKGPRILICDEPTRGIDVGAKAEVYTILADLAQKGMAIIVISSDLPEILAISDRLIVMREGQITGELTAEEASEERIMQYASGVASA